MSRPRVLIEDWLPIEELGIESRRERAVVMDLPPLFSLHVWWARRPLVASAGVILASLLPSWSNDLASSFPGEPRVETEDSFKVWFLRLCGIWGDAVAARAKYDAAVANGKHIPNPYEYKQAYKNSPTSDDLALLHQVLVLTWGALPSVLDPTAGGGSIPYESVRYGLPTTANDLNQIAAIALRGGVQIPAKFGPDLTHDLNKWGQQLVENIRTRLRPYFPSGSNEQVATYLFARSIACPRTGKPVPLSPNWWVSKSKGSEVAVRVIVESDGTYLDEPEFEVLHGEEAIASNPDAGTTASGQGLSPWDGLVIGGDHIKTEAREGRMGSILYAVAIRLPVRQANGNIKWVRSFRAPTKLDLDALRASELVVQEHLQEWLETGAVPNEAIPEGVKTSEPLRYGIRRWMDLFSPRQLLAHAVYVQEFRRIAADVRKEEPEDRGEAILGILGLIHGKALNRNSLLSTWDVGQEKMRSVFDTHNLAFKWSYAEFEACELFAWALGTRQLTRAFSGIASMMQPSQSSWSLRGHWIGRSDMPLQSNVPAIPNVGVGTAGNMGWLKSNSQTLVCIDPPYSDNVMYGELSDYFGVWEQHTVGAVWPDLMPGGLADLKNEAVANVARFADAGRRKKALAEADYEAKMHAIFAECHRVLTDNGVMTVMFTHKKATAWDALGMALMEAGFTIETSWPIKTESEQSLHQAKKNAAESTIMMVCRKREATGDTTPYFEDLEGEVRRAAKDAVGRFSAAGISGVDLLLSTYGPALSVISAHWPVYSSEADESGRSRLLRPEEALDAAREEVVRMQRLALIGRQVDLDPITDFVLLAWSTFRAVSFPFDEARKMAVAVGGLDVSELEADKILTTRSGTVTLCEPGERLRRRGDDKPGVRPAAEAFTGPAIDAVHTVLYVAEQDGLADAKALVDRTGLAGDNRFTACLQGLVRAIPRTRNKGKWVRPEAGLLDGLVTAYFPDIEVPEEWTGRLDLGV